MSEEPSFFRRRFLQGSGLAAVGLFSRTASAKENRSLEYYANDQGYIDDDGVFRAIKDRREGVITESLLNRVVRYWKSGEPVVGGESENPAQLIQSHVETLGETTFKLQIQEFKDATKNSPSKELDFQWDNQNQQSQLRELSDQNRDVNVTQLFTQDRQHVNVNENGLQVNQATLQIDKGPVYIDGRELLETLLLGADLNFEQSVPRANKTLSKYSIESHLRLPESSGYVIANESAYIAELEMQWERPGGQLMEVDIYTDMELSQSLSGLQSFEPTFNSTPSSASGQISTASSSGFVSIVDISPRPDESLMSGSTETFDLTIEYDTGSEPYGELKISVREESWGDIDKVVSIDQDAGTIDVSISEQIQSSWDQAKVIVNLYGEDGFETIDGVERIYNIGDSGGNLQLPDLEVTDVEWSPSEPTPSDDIEFKIEIINTGEARAEEIETRAYVDDELARVPPLMDLDPGEKQWSVEAGYNSFEQGNHTVRAVVDPEDKITEENEENNELTKSLSIGVDNVDVDAQLKYITVDEGAYDIGETVTTTAAVENTGNVEHTYFVGYSVYDDTGESYSNDETTGKAITLDPNESTTIELEWTVPDDAPDDEYDVTVAVWEESNRDSISTRLDEIEKSNRFTVETVTAKPDLTVDAIDWTPDSVTRSDTVSFDVTVSNQGRASAPETTVELTVGAETISTDVSSLAASDKDTVTVGSWTASEDSVTVTATVDPDSQIDETDTADNSRTRQLSITDPESEITISSIEATAATYSRGDTATVTTELENTGEGGASAILQYELSLPDGTTTQKEVPAGSTETVDTSWPIQQFYGTGSYDLQVEVVSETDRSRTLAETSQPGIFEVTESPGPVSVTIETETAKGNPVDGAQITLTPTDGGGSFSKVSDDGEVKFGRIPPGTYNIEVKSTRLNQEFTYGLEVDGFGEITRKLTFAPTDAIYGTVLNDTGLQNIPDATVSIPELEETAQTDAKGEFVFNSQIPDGEYEFEITVDPSATIVADTDTDTYTITKEIGLDRTVIFNVDANLKQPSEDTSALIREEDQFVSMLVRFFEKKDNVFAEQKFIYDYAVAKGALAGAQELIIGLWNFATNIGNLGKMIRTMWELLVAIYNNPELIQKMVSKMIEDFQKQQEKDNPFEKDTVDYATFYSGWIIGYGALQIAVIIFGDKGVSKVSKIAKSSSKLNKAVGSLKNKVSGGKLPDRSVLNRRIRPCSTTSSQVSATAEGDCVDIDMKAMRKIKEKAEKVPGLKEFLSELRKIRRRGGRKNSANLFDDIKNKNIGNIKGDLGEYQWAIQLQDKLPDNYINDFSQLSKPPIVSKLETTPNGTAKLLPGDSRIVIGENTIVKGLKLEFDAILVGRVPLDRPDGGKLKIYNISEVKTQTSPKNPEKITFQTGKKLNDIRTKVNDKGDALTENDLYAGIPMKTFKNIIDEQSSESIIRNVVPDDTAGTYKYKLKHSEKVYKSMAEEIKKDIDLLDSYTQFP